MKDTQAIDTSLAALEISSIALGYSALSILTKDQSLKVLDASPYGAGLFFILIQGTSEVLKSALQTTRSELEGSVTNSIVDHEILQGENQTLLNALHSLTEVAIEGSLVVIETATVSAGLAIAQRLIDVHGLKAIDLKIQRGVAGGLHGFFTCSAAVASPAAEDARTQLKSAMREGHVVAIDQPSPSFRRFFNFDGNETAS